MYAFAVPKVLDLVVTLCENVLYRSAFTQMASHDWSYRTAYGPGDLQTKLKYLASDHILSASARRRIVCDFELCQVPAIAVVSSTCTTWWVVVQAPPCCY